MSVDRLGMKLEGIWQHRLGLVVGPPGAGKTTLLATFASGAGVPVAWYRADRWDAVEDVLVGRLAKAFSGATRARSLRWQTFDTLADGLARWDPPRALLVVDDLHLLEGSPAETGLERLASAAPPGLHVLAGSRVQPRFNLSRLRVSGELLEVGPDDLRLRAWEVERLFRDHYREPLGPEELAHLARWTEGWAAGLQLFHLATRGRPVDERRRVLRTLGPRSRLAREYLTQNALDRVPARHRRFLVETSVLGRLSGPLCDRLLRSSGSAAILDELERRCLFTTRLNEDGDFRYHEVFRSHLQGVLVSDVGEDDARRRFQEAGDLLFEAGAPAEALDAYVRAEAWDVVEHVLRSAGEAIAADGFGWPGPHPQPNLADDPWIGLAAARRLRAEGRFGEASDAYASVAHDRRTEAAAEAARRERAMLMTWLEPGPVGPAGPIRGDVAWWALLRRALQRDPKAHARDAEHRGERVGTEPGLLLAAGLCHLASGDVGRADRSLGAVADAEEAEGLLACVASLARGAARLAGGDADALVVLHGAVGAAEGLGWEWLARVGRSLLALSGRPDHLREAERLEEASRVAGDRWGAILAAMAGAWGGLVAATGGPGTAATAAIAGASAAAERARADLRPVGAPVLEAWALGLAAAVAAAGRSTFTGDLLGRARRLAQAAVVEGAERICETTQAAWEGDGGSEAELALTLRAGLGLPYRVGRNAHPQPALMGPAGRPTIGVPGQRGGVDPTAAGAPAPGPPAPGPPAPEASAPGPPARLRLLGRFELEIGGQALDPAELRPRVRSLLHLLALHVDRPVHREALVEALWPSAEPRSASRNLHVAVASLRRVLEPHASRGGFRLVRRDGDSYRLSLPPGSWVDVVGFEHAIVEARAAAVRGDASGIERWARAALDRYQGELLPEEGPAEWLVARRDALRASAVEIASQLARHLLDRGDSVEAASACAAGLALDRYHDPLWKVLIAAREAAGDQLAATSARVGYRRALLDLGVEPASQVDAEGLT